MDTGVRTEKQNRDGGESYYGYRSQDGEIEQGRRRDLVWIQELGRRNRTGMEERACRDTGVRTEKQNRDGGESWYGYRSQDGEKEQGWWRELVWIQKLGRRNRTGMEERAGMDTGVRTQKQNREGGETWYGYRSQDGEIEQGWRRELVWIQKLGRRNRTGMGERAGMDLSLIHI